MTTAPSPFGSPTSDPTVTPAAPGVGLPSIVDTILDLDEFLSGDVRRAEKTARFATKPWLEADIEEREYELAGLVDAQGRVVKNGIDAAVSSGGGRALELATEIQQLQAEYAASFRSIRLGQLPDDDWRAFEHKHRDAMQAAGQGTPVPKSVWDELITKCALHPKISQAQLDQLRKKVGSPALSDIEQKAWDVNTKSGVSIPKSPISSRVLRQLEPEQN